MPDDLATEMGKKTLGHINGDDPWGKTVKEVTTRFTECAHDRLDHNFLFAQGWESASDLLVLEELQFSNEPPQSATITAPGPDGKSVTRSVTLGFYGPGAPGIWIAVNKTCRVTGNKIALKRQTIEKHEHSSEFVNRAWTYGAYWMKSPAEDFFTSAQAKQAKGDLDGAIADYTRVIEINPNNPKYAVAYDDRGIAKQAKGDLDGAIADCTRAIELNPKYANAYNNRGSFKGIKGDVVGAIADVNRAIELDPKLAAAYYNRAYTKQGKGDIDGAIADYTRAIELDPRCARCYYNRGGSYFNKKQYDAAIKDLQKATELDPKNGVYYSSLGWYQLFNRKPHESIAASLKALELSPDHAVMIKGNLAHGYLFDNQFEKAKALYLENKDAKLYNGGVFSQAVLDDFKELQDEGITHPDMEKIKALLTTKPEQ